MKSGLVLEGGAMRGLFTAGVIDAFLENDITFDLAIGVSAGAAFGVNLKSEQKGRVLRYNMRFAGKPYYARWSHGGGQAICMRLTFVTIFCLISWMFLIKKNL